MKRFWIKSGTMAMALMMAVVFAGCDAGGLGGVGRIGQTQGRTPVRDGVFYEEAWGYNKRFPITVRTVFARNSIVDVTIVGPNAENRPMMDSIRERLIPRIIQNQSVGVDVIAGSTLSSMGVLSGVTYAIISAGGDITQWMDPPTPRRGLVQLHDYDVIIVGLGGSGIAAFLAASEHPGTAIFGMEVAGTVGGNTSLAGGPMAVNSRILSTRFGGGMLPYIDRDALLQQWWSDMQAYVPHDLGDRHWYVAAHGQSEPTIGQTFLAPETGVFNRPYFMPPRDNVGFAMGTSIVNPGRLYNLPQIRHTGPAIPRGYMTALGAGAPGFQQPFRPVQRTVRAPLFYTHASAHPIRGGDHRDRGGGARWDVVRYLVDRSGPAVDWLASAPWNVNFAGLGGLSFPQFIMTGTLGNDLPVLTPGSVPGQMNNDDALDVHKTVMFNRILNTAAMQNPRSEFRTELRGRELITVPDATQPDGVRIVGVRARSWNGTIYEVFGRSVILATGGFIGNAEMTTRHIGFPTRYVAVATHQGDGINMARSVGGSTYNIDMATMLHIATIKNIVQQRIRSTREEDELWKGVFISLLHKRDNITIALNHGPGPMDLRGRRFVNENAAMFADEGIDFANWRAGGFYGALFSQNVIDHITRYGTVHTLAPTGIAHPQTGTDLGMGVLGGTSMTGIPTLKQPNEPIPFLPDLINIMEGHGNVIRGASLYELALNLQRYTNAPGLWWDGMTPRALAYRMRQTILHYNDLFAWYEDGRPRVPGSGGHGGGIDAVLPGSGMPDFEGQMATWAKPNTPAHLPTDPGRLNFTYPQVNPGVSVDDPVGFVLFLGAGYAYGTSGGLDVDKNMRVLHYSTTQHNLVPIRNLFAVGQESHGVLYSRENPYSAYGAVAMGWVFTSGRRAGMNAAAEAELIRAGLR